MDTIYVPMTVNILVAGHIRLIKKLIKKGDVVIGVLTSKALKGYKKERTPFKDRLEMMKSLRFPIKVVPQDSLSPEGNLKKYRCSILASGDGFEPSEVVAATKLGVKLLKVNSGSKIHSSDIQ